MALLQDVAYALQPIQPFRSSNSHDRWPTARHLASPLLGSEPSTRVLQLVGDLHPTRRIMDHYHSASANIRCSHAFPRPRVLLNFPGAAMSFCAFHAFQCCVGLWDMIGTHPAASTCLLALRIAPHPFIPSFSSWWRMGTSELLCFFHVQCFRSHRLGLPTRKPNLKSQAVHCLLGCVRRIATPEAPDRSDSPHAPCSIM